MTQNLPNLFTSKLVSPQTFFGTCLESIPEAEYCDPNMRRQHVFWEQREGDEAPISEFSKTNKNIYCEFTKLEDNLKDKA